MTFWSGEKLSENTNIISNFNPANIDVNAYNFCMGDCYFVTDHGKSCTENTKKFLREGEPFLIPPGQFAYLVSAEEVFIPHDAMALISMRTGIKFNGLINVSGFHVDPGYRGNLVYAVYNAGASPVQICRGQKIFKIWFADLDRDSAKNHLYNGSGHNTISGDLVTKMSRKIYSLQSLSEKIENVERNVDKRLDKLDPKIDSLHKAWDSLVTGITIAIFAVILTFSLPTVYEAGGKFKNWLFQTIQFEE